MRLFSFNLLVFVLLLFQCKKPANVKKSEFADRIYIKKENKKPSFLIGRLPGNNWVEHNPARFAALQSFETNSQIKRAILALYKRENEASNAKQFLQKLAKKISLPAQEVRNLLSIKTAEGSWQCLLLASDKSLSQLCAMKKFNQLYYIQYTAGDSEIFSLYEPDVTRYLKQFWFLYK